MSPVIEKLIATTLRASWQAAALVLIVIGVQVVLRKILTPRWQHALWFLVVARLLIPVMPTSSLSVFNWVGAHQQAPPRQQSAEQPKVPASLPLMDFYVEAETKIVDVAAPAPLARGVPVKPWVEPITFSWRGLGLLAWATGVAALALIVSLKSFVLFRKVNKLASINSGPVFDLLEQCRKEMGVRPVIELHEFTEIDSPALYGFLRSHLLLPVRMTERFTREELRFIFLHELAHIKRHDIAMNWLLTALQLVHWFNPMVWLGFARMRSDRELACDALALSFAGQKERRSYGMTIVRLLEEFARPAAAAPNLLGILEDKNQMQRRLTMIAQFHPTRWSFIGAAIIALLAIFTMTDAQSPAPAGDPFTPVDLRPAWNASENADWSSPNHSFQVVPHGETNLGGIPFKCDGVIQLLSERFQSEGRPWRPKVEIPLPTNQFASFHLLGGMSSGTPTGMKVADIVLTYASGKKERLPIQVNVHMKDWWRMSHEDPPLVSNPAGRAVWRGYDAGVQNFNKTLRLYCLTLENPRPAEKVTKFELMSSMSHAGVFICGFTLDARAAKDRPLPEPDLDLGDAPLSKKLAVRVVNAKTGEPVPNAVLYYIAVENLTESGQQYKSTYERYNVTGDSAGIVDVMYSDEPHESLAIDLKAPGFAPWHVGWQPGKGEAIPAEITIRLDPGVTFGGTVTDQNGLPVAGAAIRVSRYWTGGERMNRGANGTSFSSATNVTDAFGVWSVDTVPESVLDRVMLRINHADYSNYNLTPKGADIEALRSGKHIATLQAGNEISGYLTDENGKPIKGARVIYGRRYTNTSREATTDDRGFYRITKVQQEPSRPAFSGSTDTAAIVTAFTDRHAPVALKVTLGAPAIRLDFRLTPGLTVRGRVVDSDGTPIRSASISRGSNSIQAQDVAEWRGTTDDKGEFAWTGSPSGGQDFTVRAQGFRESDLRLEPGDEVHTITLEREFSISGRVLDAETQQPIAKFAVLPGSSYEANGLTRLGNYSSADEHEITDPQGKFTATFTRTGGNAVQIRANGYITQVAAVQQNASEPLVVALKRITSISGRVVDAAGNPVPKIAIAAAGPSVVQLDRGGISRIGDHVDRTSTDANGDFTLEPTAEVTDLVAADPRRFGQISIGDFNANKTIVVQANGRIVGTLYRGSEIGANVPIDLQMGSGGFSRAMFQIPEFRQNTDANGHFVFEGVPATTVSVVQLYPTSPYSWTHLRSTIVNVKPDVTTEVKIGGDGARIKGHVIPPEGTTIQAFTNLAQNCSLRDLNPANEADHGPFGRVPRMFGFVINEGGVIDAPDIPPGSYKVIIELRKSDNSRFPTTGKLIGTFQKQIVMDAADVDLGEITLSKEPIRY